MFKNLLVILSVLFFNSCNNSENILDELNPNKPLTVLDVSNGLKQALIIGSENASEILASKGGFYKDELIKISLPKEAQIVSKNLSFIPKGQSLIDKVVLNLNRAAEDAVKEAAPIFASTISEMSITDVFNILKGNKNAATLYLKNKSYSKLKTLFLPKVKSSLDKKLIANLSTNESWQAFTIPYNKRVESLTGTLLGLQPINTSLDDYVTNKALDALFLKIADEEELIRTDPFKRINTILKRVFKSQD